jgi:hypothetical protein
MRTHARSLTWHGQAFQFQRMPTDDPRQQTLWAVSRHGEFIGVMPCADEVTTKDFDLRSQRWLSELLETSRP